jgi:site-specific DNA-adenine methylase
MVERIADPFVGSSALFLAVCDPKEDITWLNTNTDLINGK